MRISFDAIRELDSEVLRLAALRAQEEDRKTIRKEDIEKVRKTIKPKDSSTGDTVNG